MASSSVGWSTRRSNDRSSDREQKEGQDAFFIALYLDEDPILVISNVGSDSTLTVDAMDYGNLPIEELERLVEEVLWVVDKSKQNQSKKATALQAGTH